MLNRPEPLQIDPGDPLKADRLGRADTIKNLSRLVRSLDGPAVISVDAPWGHGKTTFIQLWKAWLKKEWDHPSVIFDAWKADFSGDPLLSLTEEMHEALPKLPDGSELRTFAAKLLPSSISVGLASWSLDATSESKSKYVADRIAAFDGRVGAIKDLKEHLKERAAKLRVSEGGEKSPLIVFIDEMDRCRPTYAVELLEQVKRVLPRSRGLLS